MKTLYISDLDGTLFNSKKEVSDFTVDTLNKFIESGGLFTVATARTSYGCDYRLDKIKLNLPAILMNGVFLYSFNGKKYIDVKKINPLMVAQIEKVLNKYKNFGFMYTYKNNKISIFYKNKDDLRHTQYYSDRAIASCEEITLVKDFTEAAKNKDVVYFALTGQEKIIRDIWQEIKKIAGLGSVIYLNIYNDLYCLEIFDKDASKANALKRLKSIVGADEVIVFGDNHNDIDIMQAADKSYAPENAVNEVKEMATGIIDSCDEDGVAKFIKQKYKI